MCSVASVNTSKQSHGPGIHLVYILWQYCKSQTVAGEYTLWLYLTKLGTHRVCTEVECMLMNSTVDYCSGIRAVLKLKGWPYAGICTITNLNLLNHCLWCIGLVLFMPEYWTAGSETKTDTLFFHILYRFTCMDVHLTSQTIALKGKRNKIKKIHIQGQT